MRQPLPHHPSFPVPQRPSSSGMHPQRPPPGYPQPGMYHPAQHRPPIVSPIPRIDQRQQQQSFPTLVSTQPLPESARKDTQEEDQPYESYEPSLPEAQPLQQHSFSQAYGQPASQSRTQPQSNNILVQETHIPRRPPQPSTSVDLLGGFSPPTSSIALPPARQRTQPETIIPETRLGTQPESQSQEEASQPKRVDTYRPHPTPRQAPVEMGRQANVWQMCSEVAGYGGPGRRSASVMPRPATSMGGGYQEGRMTRPAGMGAAELFMAATQQQAGGAKTNSEKIMDALSGELTHPVLGAPAHTPEWSTQILADVADLRKDQKQVRDQVHAVQTGQKALATREEVVEEITAQLSPALHEFFQALHAKIETSVKPLPDETAKLAGEKVRGIMMEIKQIEASQRSQEDNHEKPIVKLLDHLISKLDSVSHISDFLNGCKDLPDALRDVAIYKQSMDVLSAKLAAAPPPPPSLPAPAPQPQVDLRGLPEAIGQLNAQVHQLLTRPIVDPSENGRVLSAITTLAKGLDQLLLNLPSPQPAPQTQAQDPPVEPPKLSSHVIRLQGTVDTLSKELREIKAMMADIGAAPVPAPIAPQPTLDVAELIGQLRTDIVGQLKAALPALIASSLPFATAQAPALPIHPPLLRPADPNLPSVEDYSQLQPTEVGNSQSQTARAYPTPTSNFPSRAFTQPSSDFGPSGSETIGEPSFEAQPSATAPPEPVLTLGSPFAAASAIPRRRTQTSVKLIGGQIEVHPPSDIFGQVKPISAAKAHPSATGPSGLGAGNLGVEIIEEDPEVLDDFDDLFDQSRPSAGPARTPGGFGKGKGKRSASNSGSTPTVEGPSKKRVRTRTSGPAPSTGDKPKSHKKKAPIPSSSTPKREPIDMGDNSPSTGADFTLLDPSSIPGGGVLKRSPRLVAVRTESDDPMYNSDLAVKAGGGGRKKPSQSKVVKQELIDITSGGEVLGGGSGGRGSSSAQPISIDDSDSLGKSASHKRSPLKPSSPAESDDSLNSLSLRYGTRSRAPARGKASGSGSGMAVDMSGEGQVLRRQVRGQAEEAEQSLVSPRKDPAPMVGGTRYHRKKRLSDVSWGGDDSDGDDGL